MDMPSSKKKLTKRIVEGIIPSEKETFVWDTEVPGFGLRVWPSGKRVFVYQYRNAYGQTRRPALGKFGAVTVEQARQKARTWSAEVHSQGDPSHERKQTRKAPTLTDLAERYVSEHARVKKKPSSVRSDEALLRLHILPALGFKKAIALDRADVAKLHHSMRKTPGAANRVIALLSKMMNLAEKWSLRPDGSNPCRHIEKYPERRMERFLSEDELARLGEALREAEHTQTALPSAIAAIRLLLFTGMRLTEVLTLRWENVDFYRQCIHLPESKTGAKVVYLNAPALKVLSDLEGNSSDWVISGAKHGQHLINLRKPWHRIRRKAGLDGVRIHDLRHSFASMAVAGGLSLPVIGALLGHSQPATTARYAHLADDPLKQAANLTGSRIASAMTKRTLREAKSSS